MDQPTPGANQQNAEILFGGRRFLTWQDVAVVVGGPHLNFDLSNDKLRGVVFARGFPPATNPSDPVIYVISIDTECEEEGEFPIVGRLNVILDENAFLRVVAVCTKNLLRMKGMTTEKWMKALDEIPLDGDQVGGPGEVHR